MQYEHKNYSSDILSFIKLIKKVSCKSKKDFKFGLDNITNELKHFENLNNCNIKRLMLKNFYEGDKYYPSGIKDFFKTVICEMCKEN